MAVMSLLAVRLPEPLVHDEKAYVYCAVWAAGVAVDEPSPTVTVAPDVDIAELYGFVMLVGLTVP